jgi:hypothetical protein
MTGFSLAFKKESTKKDEIRRGIVEIKDGW